MSLQACLSSRKDCSGDGKVLPLSEIKDICKSTHQADPSKTFFVILPDSPDYSGGIYKYLRRLFSAVRSGTYFCC